MDKKRIASFAETMEVKPQRTPIHADEIIPHSLDVKQALISGCRVGAIIAAVAAVGFGKNYQAVFITAVSVAVLLFSFLGGNEHDVDRQSRS